MYEQHFGSSEHLSATESAVPDVFVGPRSAEAMTGIKKALRTRDAVVAVSGPAGSGKSTLVAKTLDALDDRFRVAWIGRMRLTGSDVLEFLLNELGVAFDCCVIGADRVREVDVARSRPAEG